MLEGIEGKLATWISRKPHEPVILAPGRLPLSWAGLEQFMEAMASRLHDAGIGTMSRIAVLLPAGPDAATVCLAAMRCGIVIPLNPDLIQSELASALARLRPHLLISTERTPANALQVAATMGIPVLVVEWGADDLAGFPRFQLFTDQALVPEDADSLSPPSGTRLILQTSGTTAQAKLVPLSEENLFCAAQALIASLGLSEEDRGLNLLPQFHIGGLWDLIAGPLFSGGSVICGGTFSTAAFEKGCAMEPTWTQLVPTMLRSVVESPATAIVAKTSGIRFVRSVSAALPQALKLESERTLGIPVIEIYGMSESAGVIASTPLAGSQQRLGSVGLPVGPEVLILDRAGNVVQPGEEGEVVLRGKQVVSGYLLASPTDNAAFAHDGFHTGDLGRVDAAGYLWLSGRIKDMINRGGEKIAPAEIEDALLFLPWVRDVAAFGIPHPTLGEDIAVAVVFSMVETEAVLLAQTRAALRSLLGYHRTPAHILSVGEIPRTRGGKIQRQRLAQQFVVPHPSVSSSARSTEGDDDWGAVGQWVATIWSTVLNREPFGPNDDFFMLGGTSLLAAQAVALIQNRFPDQILYVSSVYEAPTPKSYEDFLRDYHPDLVARILGASVRAQCEAATPISAQMMDAFSAAVVNPLGPGAYRPTTPQNPPAVFLLSAPRSGSTLLRAVLAGHRALFAPPELYLLGHRDLCSRRHWFGVAHASQLEGLPRAVMGARGCSAEEANVYVARLEAACACTEVVYRELQAAIGGRLLVDKTPYYSANREVLEACERMFDGAIYIHLSRHPYGMIQSFVEARLGQLWWPRLTGPAQIDQCPFHPHQLAEMLWIRINSNILGFLENIPRARRIHVRYEDFVGDPLGVSGRICKHLGIEFDPEMLDPLGSSEKRMTDGLGPSSRMIGDPKFHTHRGISQASASRWKQHFEYDFLSARGWEVASMLGHEERVSASDERIILEI